MVIVERGAYFALIFLCYCDEQWVYSENDREISPKWAF